MNEEEKEAKEKAKGFFLKLGWILFIFLVAAILGAMFLPKMVHASMAWPLNKVQTCTFLNVTGNECDSLWCNVLDCNYSTTKQACLCSEIINNTVYINQTVNVTSADLNSSAINWSAFMQSQNLSSYANKSYIDEVIAAFELRIANDENYSIALKDRLNEIQYQPVNTSSPPNYWFYGFVVLIIAGVVVYVVWMNMNKKKTAKGEAQSFVKGFKFKKKVSEEPIKKVEVKKKIADEEELEEPEDSGEKEDDEE